MKQTIITLTLLGCAVSFSAESQNLAVKTNLLSDAFAVPEAAVEFAFADKWSAELGANFIDWKIGEGVRKHWFVRPGARYWFCERFAGHFIGLDLMAGEFNFGNIDNNIKFLNNDFRGLRDKRYQGWGAGAGIAYGYTWMLSKHWSVEATLGVGWLYTRYDVYPCASCGRKLRSGAVHNYVGPTKAGINLIYIF